MPETKSDNDPPPAWRERLLKLFEENPKLKMATASKRAGFSPSWVRDLLLRGHDPSLSKFIRLCEAIGVEPSDIIKNRDSEATAELSVNAITLENDDKAYFPSDKMLKQLGKVPVIPNKSNSYTIFINGTMFAPRLNPGDIAVFVKVEKDKSHKLMGDLCLIQSSDGNYYIKIPQETGKAGYYNLESYDRAGETLTETQVTALYRLELIRPISE